MLRIFSIVMTWINIIIIILLVKITTVFITELQLKTTNGYKMIILKLMWAHKFHIYMAFNLLVFLIAGLQLVANYVTH
jgi:hypothetical protein